MKASTEKTHFVCNIGNCKTNFKLHTKRLELVQHGMISNEIFLIPFIFKTDVNKTVQNEKKKTTKKNKNIFFLRNSPGATAGVPKVGP